MVRKRYMLPVNWPDYLFRIVLDYPDAVDEVNHIIAIQRGATLLW